MFKSARLKLTAWYLLIIMLISMSFSVVIYKVLIREVERFARVQEFRIERRYRERESFNPEMRFLYPTPSAPITDTDLVRETKQRIILLLAIVNSAIFVISGGLGYLLAGKTLKPIKEMMDEQNRFISNASHELRTPLTSLKTTMEVSLRDNELSLKGAKRLISESVNEVNKLQSLSDELLQLAQYEKPNENLNFETVSLVEVVKEAIRKMEPLAKQKQIMIKNETEDYEIEGNKYGLIDLLVILLDNAVKYSPRATTVTIQSKKNDGLVLVSIKDEGVGIDKKDLSHIFNRFYRADSARTKTSEGGYGLGLSIAKKIVEIHHGSIDVESKIEKGTTFTIRLPIN